MKKIKKFWPLIFILVVWFVFANPFFLHGKVPFSSTYLANAFGPWSAYLGESAGPVKNNAAPDVIGQIFPWKKLAIDIWKNGNLPLWNPYVFSGTPLLANYQSAVLSPSNLLYLILPFIDAWSIQILLQPLFAGLFMYFFCRALKLSDASSLISSLAFMFCGFITTWMMYGTLGYAILFLPLALFSIEKFANTKKWFYQVLLTVSIPLSLLSGHFQTSLYFLIFILGYVLFKFITKKDVSTLITNLFSVSFGLLLCGPQLLPSIEFYGESVRSALFAKSEVIPWAYLPTFLAPDFFGNPVTRNAWFGHYAEWNAYVGLIPLILGVFSLNKRKPYIIFFAITAVISIALAFQTPLLDLLVALKIPVLSTSAASRVIVIFSFSFAVLAGFGFENLIESIVEKKFGRILILCLIPGLLLVFFWTLAILRLFIPADKAAIMISNLKLPTIIFLIFMFTVFIPKFIKSKKTILAICIVLVLITALDMLRFVTKWQPFDPKNLVYPEVPVANVISSIAGYDRGFGAMGQEGFTMLRMRSIEGYDPLFIARYGEFIKAANDGSYRHSDRSVVELPKHGQYTGKIIDFLGVKYIVHKISDAHDIWAFPFWSYPLGQFKTLYYDGKYQILKNDKTFPRAFLVYNFEIQTKTNGILDSIFRKSTDLKSKVILEEDPKTSIASNASGSAIIKSYTANNIEISVNSNSSGLLVLSDPYYPGWKAYVDGKTEKILRADYAFRSVVVPDGKHTVSFIYDPNSFKIGLLLGMIGIIGTIGEVVYLKKK